MKGRLKISSDGLFIFIKESEMLVYMDDEGFDEGRIKAPILRPFLMYTTALAAVWLSVLYFTFKNEDFSLLHLDVVMQFVLYVFLWLLTQIAFFFTLPTVSFGRKGFMVKGGCTNLYQKEDLAHIVYSENEGLWIETLSGREYRDRTVIFERPVYLMLMQFFPEAMASGYKDTGCSRPTNLRTTL
ncbi:hypothetical protein [Neisseria sp. oral taxon 014]|uniref:hypothetical protein n=1 Tax=Neisseria sp. oral taxon 014 TaxID=641148 RepID=UPI0025FF1ED4|nr:hypothetical protein [Neisseria sp. oral taxon 014]